MFSYSLRWLLILCMTGLPSFRASGQSSTLKSGTTPSKTADGPRHASPVLPRGALLRLQGGSNPFLSVAYSPDGKWLASGGYEKTIQIWDAGSGKEIRRWSAPEGNITGLIFSPDGRLLASGGVYDANVHLWDAATGRELHLLDGLPRGTSSLAFSPDGKMVAAGGYHTGEVYLWNTVTGKPVRQLSGPTVRCPEIDALPVPPPDFSHVAFAPDGRTLASGHLHGLIRIWDLATLRELRHFRGPTSDPFVHLAFSGDGQTLVGWGSHIRLWRAGAWKQLRFFGEQPELRISCVALSPDGKMIASGSAGRDVGDPLVHLWEAATGEERARLEGHEYAVSSVAFSPEGRKLVSGSRDGTAVIWDVLKPPSAQPIKIGLQGHELASAWRQLADADAERAYHALITLVHNPGQAVGLLRDRLRPVFLYEAQRLDQFIYALDSSLFRDRQEAVEELALQVELAEPALRRALAAHPSSEARRSLEQILKANSQQRFSARKLQMLRAVEALEHIGGVDARKVLELVATGTPEFQITREARTALSRLGRSQAAR